MRQYTELEITLRRREAAGYPVEMRFFDLQRVETRFPGYADIGHAELQGKSPAERGKAVGRALFAEESIRNGLRTALTVSTATADTALRVRLYIDPAADQELHRLPWETLCDERGEPLFAGSRVLFSRYLTGAQGGRQRPIRNRADSRALIVVANDEEGAEISGLAPVRVAEERQRAEEGFRGAGIACRVLATGEADSLGPATADGILAQLDHGYDILYLVCHGAFEVGKPFLYLEEGRVDPGGLVERIRHSQMQPRLVFLASCESAGDKAGEILSAFGSQLVEAGIPAVIAMREKLLMRTLEVFLPEFLAELAKAGGQIDRAMGIARERAKNAGRQDFWAPVLFSRLTTGRLWDSEEPRVRGLFRVPGLPEDFVARPGLAEEIVKSLTGGAHTVVQGAGGFGKTTLAIDAARRAEIADAFPDGVLWASLGTKPDLGPILSDLYGQVTGEKPAVGGLEQLVLSFADAVKGRRCLIVLDDVWRAEDLKPFVQVQGPRLLMTTRQLRLMVEAGQSGWCEVPVEELGLEESVAFLGRGLALPEPAPEAFRRLAGQLGGWPLLLDLVNARLREEAKAGRGVEFVSKLFEKKGVLGFDRRDSQSRTAAVANSVEAGLERAEEMFPGLALKAMEISIFAENVAIPEQVLQELWGLDEFDLEEDVLRPLDNLSVLRWDRDARVVRLHMMIDLALEELLKKTGGSAAAVHRRLIEAWGDPCRLGHAYAWRWFGWHCRQAGDWERLKGLLRDFDWLRAKLEATDINALLDDFERVGGGDRELRLLQGALRLSAHVLARDKSLLAGQLLGRIPIEEEGLRGDLERKALGMREPWLRPLRPTLTAPGGALLLTLAGHTDSVGAVAITPDGTWAVSAADDMTLKVWDLANGAEVRTLAGHTGAVTSVAITPDGTRAVSASSDGTLKVWDLATGTELRTLADHTNDVDAVAMMPDGTRAVSASSDGTLKVWDLATGTEVLTLADHWSHDNSIAITPDGTRVVSAYSDGTLKVWDLESGTELRTLAGHTDRVLAVTITPDGTRAVSGSLDKTLKVWDLATGRAVRTLAGDMIAVSAVAITPDGGRAVSALGGHTLKVWDLATGTEVRTLAGHMREVRAVAITQDGRRAVSASEDFTLKVWDLDTGTEARTPADHPRWLCAAAITRDGGRAVSASWDGTLKVWDLATGTEVRTLAGHTDTVRTVAITPDGTRAVSASWGKTLKVWDLATGTEVRTLAGHTDSVYAVAITPDGGRAVSGSWDRTLKVWDLATGTEVRTLAGHTGAVATVAITPDGTRAVSASWDDTLMVWDVATGIAVGTLSGYGRRAVAIVITPDGTRAASVSEYGESVLWEIAADTEVPVGMLESHASGVRAAAITPDGRRAVLISGGQLEVCDLGTSRCIGTFECDALATWCAFAGDGSILACDEGGALHILSLEGF